MRFGLEHGDRPTPLDGVLGMAYYIRSLSLINSVGAPPMRRNCTGALYRLDHPYMVFECIMNALSIPVNIRQYTGIPANKAVMPLAVCKMEGECRRGALRK
jgi:hypothetical protein